MNRFKLNEHKRTAYDERNNEAKNHIGHEVYFVRKKSFEHAINGSCDISDVICMDCKKQFKAYNWKD